MNAPMRIIEVSIIKIRVPSARLGFFLFIRKARRSLPPVTSALDKSIYIPTPVKKPAHSVDIIILDVNLKVIKISNRSRAVEKIEMEYRVFIVYPLPQAFTDHISKGILINKTPVPTGSPVRALSIIASPPAPPVSRLLG